MPETEEKIAGKIKDIINKNGLPFITDKPYRIYEELLRSKITDKTTAGAILYALVNGVHEEAKNNSDVQELSKIIQNKCQLKKSMADRIAYIFSVLYSDDNKSEWKKKNKEGLKQFLPEEAEYTWKGFAVWDAGNGTVDCHYEAEIILMPLAKAGKNKALAKLLKDNPFMTKKEIKKFFEEDIRNHLDSKFEWYCTCDDYYQPVVEDFEIDAYVTDWCEENGFELISCDGDGDDSGYEPKYRSGWY